MSQKNLYDALRLWLIALIQTNKDVEWDQSFLITISNSSQQYTLSCSLNKFLRTAIEWATASGNTPFWTSIAEFQKKRAPTTSNRRYNDLQLKMASYSYSNLDKTAQVAPENIPQIPIISATATPQEILNVLNKYLEKFHLQSGLVSEVKWSEKYNADVEHALARCWFHYADQKDATNVQIEIFKALHKSTQTISFRSNGVHFSVPAPMVPFISIFLNICWKYQK